METMTVRWQKRNEYLFWDHWCQLDLDILNDTRLEVCSGADYYGRNICFRITGVYIIWAGTDNRTILKVGSGIIKDRLQAHLKDPQVQAYKHRGLYVTWAPFLFVDRSLDKQRDVERFLGVLLNPKLTERLPNNVDAIWVNLPEWDKPEKPFLRAIGEQFRNKKTPFSL